VKGVGEPCAGEPHARFDGRGLETERYGVTAPAPDPTTLDPAARNLTDAINAYAKGRAVYGQVILGNWYDTGNPADYLVAPFAFALAHPSYGPALSRSYGS